MTLTTIIPSGAATLPERSWLGSKVHDVIVLTRRNLVHITREPLQLSDVTVQPVLFTLLFVFVFGSGVPIHGGSYKDFAIAGLMLLNLTTSAMGTAVGLISDLTTGAIDRFRTLPMWRSAVLGGTLGGRLLVVSVVPRHRGAHRPRDRMATRRQCAVDRGRVRHRAAVQLCALLGLCLPRHRLEGT